MTTRPPARAVRPTLECFYFSEEYGRVHPYDPPAEGEKRTEGYGHVTPDFRPPDPARDKDKDDRGSGRDKKTGRQTLKSNPGADRPEQF